MSVRKRSVTDLPAPLTAADADLTDFKFMPLDVRRLQKSKAWLICKRKPDVAFYMLNLWLAAWHERPAGSLENDDDVLADAAMCSPEKWAGVKADVLRNWIRCSDGRLYHEVVAEKVNEAWEAKIAQRTRTTAARIAALSKRLEQASDTAVKEQVSREIQRLRLRLSQASAVSVTENVTRTETETKGQGQGQGERKGQGQGQGDSEGESASPPAQPPAPVGPVVETPSRATRGSRLPSDWTLPEDWREWATTELLSHGAGLPAAMDWVARAADRFRDHWLGKSGKDGVKADWEATWRNWVRRDIDDGKAPKAGKGANEQADEANSRRSAERVAAVVARLAGKPEPGLGRLPGGDAGAVLPAVPGG